MNRKAEHWVKQIDHLLNNDVRFVYGKRKQGKAKETLQGIKEMVEERGTITDKQIQAIKNLKWGKNELR